MTAAAHSVVGPVFAMAGAEGGSPIARLNRPQSAESEPVKPNPLSVDEMITDNTFSIPPGLPANMRSKELNLESYNTPKITHGYLEVYDPILAPWVDKKIKLLEIGIRKGESSIVARLRPAWCYHWDRYQAARALCSWRAYSDV
jgi:hypothetical protein